MNRRVKQIIYGTGYLVVLGVIVFGIYWFWAKPAASCFDGKQNGGETGIDCGGNCVSCEIKSLFPFHISWQKYFISENGTTAAIEIKNPNPDYGADYFDYEISILDAGGNLLQKTSGSSYIYAGEIKHIVEILPISSQEIGEIATVSADFSNINWKPKEEFVKPEIQPRSLVAELNQIPPTISGLAANASPLLLSRATIFGFLYNNSCTTSLCIASASKTELENIPAFGEKSFKLTFPGNLNLESVNGNYKIYIEAR